MSQLSHDDDDDDNDDYDDDDDDDMLAGEGGQARSRALRKTHSWAPLSSPASTQGHHHHQHQHVLVMHGQDYEKFHASTIIQM